MMLSLCRFQMWCFLCCCWADFRCFNFFCCCYNRALVISHQRKVGPIWFTACGYNPAWQENHGSRSRSILVTLHSKLGSRKKWMSCQLCPVYAAQGSWAQRVVLPIFRACLSTLISLVQKIPHIPTQRFVSMGILNPIKLTIKINCHMMEIALFPTPLHYLLAQVLRFKCTRCSYLFIFEGSL